MYLSSSISLAIFSLSCFIDLSCFFKESMYDILSVVIEIFVETEEIFPSNIGLTSLASELSFA